jgi:phosphate transport system protein
MTRAVFERQLTEVQEDMLVLAGMVESAISQSIDALRDRDVALARRIVENDAEVNRKRFETEEKCIELITLQAPMASDLRTIISVLHITVDLERMGDHAEGIARIALMLADEPPLKPLIDIPRMAEVAIEMLHGSLEAYKTRDPMRAREIIGRDDTVDALYEQVYRELLMFMINDPKTIQRATYLIWVAHNLERIADRATNICERVVYLVEGRILDLDLGVSKY